MFNEIKITGNTGVIDCVPKLGDYRAGGETGIAYEVRQPNGDWRIYRPTEEKQASKKTDSMGCTFFSQYNDIEEQVEYLKSTGELSGEKLKKLEDNGYFDENGKFNLSDRFGNVVGGTTESGNYLYMPWEVLKKHGALPEIDFQAPADFTWEEYYQEPGIERRNKAKIFLDVFDVKWEWVISGATEMNDAIRDQMITHIKQAPLHVATPVCPGWLTGVFVSPCGKISPQHATIIDCIDSVEQFFHDFDHYYPFGKTLSKHYVVPAVIKGVLTVKKDVILPPLEKFHYVFTRKITYGEKSEEVKKLQKALKINGVFPVSVLETGTYGNITREAVRKFLVKYNIGTWLERRIVDGRWVGPKTRNKLNILFNK